MNCIQVTDSRTVPGGIFHPYHAPSAAPTNAFYLRRNSLTLTVGQSIYHFISLSKGCSSRRTSASSYKQRSPVCLFGDKGKTDNDAGASPWKSLEKAMGNLKKEPSIEDLLRQQIEKQEYFDDGAGGGQPPGGSGGGGRGGAGGSSSGPEDDLSGTLDEILQVTLATIGLIFVYFYIIEGEQMSAFIRDTIRALFTGQKSNRLRRFMYMWGRFYQRLIAKKEYNEYPYWLESAIINTPTWYDSPEFYKSMLMAQLGTKENAPKEDYPRKVTSRNDDWGEDSWEKDADVSGDTWGEDAGNSRDAWGDENDSSEDE